MFAYTVLLSTGAQCTVVALRDFILRCVRTFLETGSAHTRYRGRRPTLSEDLARACALALCSGYIVLERQEAGAKRRFVERQKYFRSVAEAVRMSPLLKSVCEEYGIVPCTLLRNLQRWCPGLRKRHLHPRKALSQQNMDERVEFCEKLMGKPRPALMKYLSRVFWIDSKTFYIEPEGRMVWAPADANMTVVDERMPKSRREEKKIHYYAVVNALLGPVYIEYCTGTTGHAQDVMRPAWAPQGIQVNQAYQVSRTCLPTQGCYSL